ncbi:fimbrial protein [Providencia rettgeri]|uniref:fimbrial protein n=1 Tax=Providencia rettgeri TaxID=587 RepID=UPI0005B3A548|nr:fimbrial protein [Providencia rettgeri]
MTKLFNISFGIILTCFSYYSFSQDNLHFYGSLVQEPCVVLPENSSIDVDFRTIADKDLYAYGRSRSETFSLILSECDTSLGNSFSISFLGGQHDSLPGFLALSANSDASGFGIGIEDKSGGLLPIGDKMQKILLVDGSNTITFRAYLKAEPEAISNKSIKRGGFNALATFKIDYE